MKQFLVKHPCSRVSLHDGQFLHFLSRYNIGYTDDKTTKQQCWSCRQLIPRWCLTIFRSTCRTPCRCWHSTLPVTDRPPIHQFWLWPPNGVSYIFSSILISVDKSIDLDQVISWTLILPICMMLLDPGPPGMLFFIVTSFTSLNVSWLPPTSPNGIIENYLISYYQDKLVDGMYFPLLTNQFQFVSFYIKD